MKDARLAIEPMGFHILAAVVEHGGWRGEAEYRPVAFAAGGECTYQTGVYWINRLATLGLVRWIAPDEDDDRQRVAVTELGRRVFKAHVDRAAALRNFIALENARHRARENA